MSHLVFFIATLIALAISVSVITTALKGVTYAINERMSAAAQQASTIIKIVEGYPADTNDYIITYVKNLGSVPLDVNGFDVFVNGSYVGGCDTISCVDETNNGILSPNELMEVNIPYTLSIGTYRIRVVAENGVYSDFEVIVG